MPVDRPAVVVAPEQSVVPPPPAAEGDAPFAKVVQEATDYARTLLRLFLGELQIARGSFVRMLAVGALVPVFLLTIWSALNLLVAAIVARVLGDWIYGYLAILVLNGILVWVCVMALKRWKGDLTLPRSRDALARLLERIK